jgi:hypothetical protein
MYSWRWCRVGVWSDEPSHYNSETNRIEFKDRIYIYYICITLRTEIRLYSYLRLAHIAERLRLVRSLLFLLRFLSLTDLLYLYVPCPLLD